MLSGYQVAYGFDLRVKVNGRLFMLSLLEEP